VLFKKLQKCSASGSGKRRDEKLFSKKQAKVENCFLSIETALNRNVRRKSYNGEIKKSLNYG